MLMLNISDQNVNAKSNRDRNCIFSLGIPRVSCWIISFVSNVHHNWLKTFLYVQLMYSYNQLIGELSEGKFSKI